MSIEKPLVLSGGYCSVALNFTFSNNAQLSANRLVPGQYMAIAMGYCPEANIPSVFFLKLALFCFPFQ
ncbi:hypothetical protein XELAEV_18020977mg [Xenopus laevis]|uniref:Uncharacterized protein n=1 Tax=Xenopus laevis TaxID=8355 RepID=A0A974D801_XENLA|nr:hypothetical protein XELAEV_18020977mg [Xenopus laevis]